MANDITYKIGAEETVSPALNKIQASVAKTSAVFSRLQGAIAGIAFGAAIQSALSYADAIADISDATEIGIANVLGFGNAVSQLGGNSEKAQSAIAKFGLTLGDALNGSLNAQNSFNDLGITLTDLARLDSQGLFDLTLKRLSELDDVTKRNRISSELFGKTLRGVDLKSLYDQYGRLTEAGRKYAEDIKKGAELQDKLSAAMSKFKLEILKALSPLIEFLNNLKPEQIEAFVSAVVKIGGAAVALTTLVSGFKAISGVLGYAIAAGVGFYASFKVGLAGVATAAQSLGKTFTIFISQMGYAWKALTAAVSSGSVGAVFKSLSTTIEVLATKRLPNLAIGIGGAILGFSRMIPLVGTVISVLMLVNEGIKLAFNIDPIDLFLTKVADAYYAFKEFIGLQGRQPKEQPAGPVGNAGRGDGKIQLEAEKKRAELQAAEAEKMQEMQKGLELKRMTIRQTTADFRQQLDSQIAQVKFQSDLIGKSETQKEVMTAVAAITKEAADKTADLKQEMAKLQGVEKDQLTPTYMAQIAAIEILRKAKSLEIEEAIRGSALKKAAYELELYGIKEQQQAFDDLLRIQREMSQIGLGDQAKQQMDIAFAADERARAEIRSLEASRGTILTEAEKNKIFEISRSQLGALTTATNQLAEAKEKFAKSESIRLFDLKSEYELQDKLLNIQRETADVGLLGIEKGYRDIARAADDSAKAAIRAEEERRSAIAGTRVFLDPAEVQEYYNKARKGTEDLVKAQKNLYDTSRKFSTGWNSAFKKYIEDATNAANIGTRMFEKFTSGIEDLIVDFAKTGKFEWKSFVTSMGEELLRSQIKQTMASVLQMPNPFSSSGGSISDLFGGIFGALGGGSGEIGSSASNPMYVVDIAGGGGGGGILGGGGSAGGGAGGGIMGTIGNIFTGVKDAVGSVFGGIGNAVSGLFGGGNSAPSTTSGGGFGGGIVDSIGSLFGGGGNSGGGGFLDSITSGIGDFFGGFFANGGNLAPGKFGVVGERGPEFIGGPASITPMSGSANVTYNINAVDARSFQQLLASDPSFIYALTEQGRKSFAGVR
jgi:lambda family phage tail tape measure protein